MRLLSHSGPRRRRRAGFGFELLEQRSLLSATSPFASFQGRFDGPMGDAITARVDPADFGLAAGDRVILRFDARASGDGLLDPGPTLVRGSSPQAARVLTRRADVPGGTASVTLASVRPGGLTIRPTAHRGTAGDFELEISLAGDADGDGRVDRTDLRAIWTALGRPVDSQDVAPGADADGDGRVGLLDLLIASRNLGASTTVRPQEVTLGIDPAADPDRDGRVDADSVNVVGRAAPGVTVRLDLGADGSSEAATTADAKGRYRFTVPLKDGPNPIAVEASDRFGQVAEARITVIRGEPARPVSASFDFARGEEGWEAGFTDLPADPGEEYELESGVRPLPPEPGVDGTGYLLRSHNRSDDVFMFIKRRLGAAEGIQAHQAYEARFTITYASNAPSEAFGIGGSPGESVYLKAGAGPVEPLPVVQDGEVGLNVDKGQQGVGGPAASLVGNIANGQEPVTSGPQPYVAMRVEHTHTAPARADAAGNLWLLVGTDSGFEGLTALYYRRIDVELSPVAA